MLWWIFSVVFVQDYKVNLMKCELIDVVSVRDLVSLLEDAGSFCF